MYLGAKIPGYFLLKKGFIYFFDKGIGKKEENKNFFPLINPQDTKKYWNATGRWEPKKNSVFFK